MDGFEVVSPYINGVNDGSLDCIDTRLMDSTDLIVTCTNVSVCDEQLLRTVAKHAIVCNIGHFDTEIDAQFMRDHWLGRVKPQVHKIYRSDDQDDFISLCLRGA